MKSGAYILFLMMLVFVNSAYAGDYDFDVPEIELADWQVAGDGKTPTFLQYLDLKGVQAKESKHLMSATSKGDVVYSYDLELPPALLKPSLSLAYSSEAGMNVEAPYGWEVKGILEIRRPLVRAYATGDDDQFGNEWLISGPGFSGTLKPSGDEDYWFYLKSSSPTRVKAKLDIANNSWEVHANGITWTLTEQDGGEGTEAGTALWRATKMADGAGNYVTYFYHTDGRINGICYGGNETTGEEHLVDVEFEYESNTANRTNARAGFKTTYKYHVSKITVGAHDDACTTLKANPSQFDKIERTDDIGVLQGTLTHQKNGTQSGSAIPKTEIKTGALANQNIVINTNKKKTGSPTVNQDVDVGTVLTQQQSKGAATTSTNQKAKKTAKAAPAGNINPQDFIKTDAGAIATDINDADDTGIGLSGGVKLEQKDISCVEGWYAYDLEFTVRDSLDLFTKLSKVGGTNLMIATGGCLNETIAEFEYSEFDDSDTAARTGTAPASLGSGKSESDGDDEPSNSYTTGLLSDITGDGLADVIDATGWNDNDEIWEIKHQKVNHSARTFSWENKEISSGEIESYPGAVYTEASRDASTATRALLQKQLVDLDGDGFLDFLISTNRTSWSVYWGNGEHRFEDRVSLTPPEAWDAAQISWAVKADSYGAEDFTADVVLGLVDLDGDGYLDAYDPNEQRVWYYRGGREDGAGWTESKTLSQQFEALRSVKYTIDSESYEPDISDFCEDEAEDACSDAADEALDECTEACEEDDEFACQEECEQGCEEDCDYLEDDAYDECFEQCTDENDCERPDDCIDSCIEGCEDDSEDVYDDCEWEFLEECENGAERTRTKYISATDEIGAFYDMNGDGLPDYVDSSETPWKVYLNNGTDFEDAVNWSAPVIYSKRVDEGRPEINYESGEFDIDDHESGENSRVYQMLVDVDGDGLIDLALGKSLGDKWYKNTGTKFESSSRDLPGWWPDDFVVSNSETDVNADDGESESTSETTGTMMDIDHDGMVDYVYSTGIKYGPYPKPNLLISVKNGKGGTTTTTYRSLATVKPSGDWDVEQKTANVKFLADTIFSIDGYTGQNAETSYSYEDGEFTDGVFYGFLDRDITRKINNLWTSETKYDYELSRDFDPLVTNEKLFVDGNLSFGSAIKKSSTTNSKQRFQIENTYTDYTAGMADFRLITNRKVIEYGETTGNKSYNIEFAWDNDGNMTQYHHKGGAGTEDEITVTMQYYPNTGDDDDADFFRMTQKTVNGTDRLSGAVRDFQVEKYYYDGNAGREDPMTAGLLTKSEVSAGWVAGGDGLLDETLAIEYTRGTRGEISSVLDKATNVKMDQNYGFGGAVLMTQTNGLGHKLTRTIDSRGRVTKITDDNGMSVGFSYDAFNRVTKKTATGSDGKSYTLKASEYERDTAYYDVTKWYKDDGSVEETGYDVQDGFGNVAQIWRQNESGNYLMTTQITDLRGLPVKSSHPVDKGSAFIPPMTSFAVTNPFSVSYHDALGEQREHIRDSAVASGSQLVYHDNPRESLSQDEEGYQTRLTYDVHQRVTKVEQGKGGIFTTTAQYSYDPLNRLVRFEDGGGVYYTYSHDGAGRLRKVQHGSATTAATDWYTYEYKGLMKTKMQDATGAYTSWEHDALGRVIKQTVSDSLPSASGDLVYEYEYDTKWKGALSKLTDPAGVTEYTYDTFGREAKASRSYNASTTMPSGVTAEFSYARDIRNRLSLKTLPSGKQVSLVYKYGHLSELIAKDAAGAKQYDLTFDYNNWDLWSLVCSSKGHEFSREFTTPLQPDLLRAYHGGKAYERDYEWKKNSLLAEVEHTTDSEAEGLCKTFNKYPGGGIIKQTPVDDPVVKKPGNKQPKGDATLVPTAPGVVVQQKDLSGKNLNKTKTAAKDVVATDNIKSKTQTVSKKSSQVITGTQSSVATAATATGKTKKAAPTAKTSGSGAVIAAAPAAVVASGVPSGAVATGSSGSGAVTASAIPITMKYAYSYDNIKQLILLTSENPMLGGVGGALAGPKTVESYAYNAGGNLTSMKDNLGATWTYGHPGTLNQIASRTSDKGGNDSYVYDAAGRMSKWVSAAGTYEYYYDGMGRLRGVTLNGAWNAVYDYDDTNKVLRIADNNPFTGSPYYVYNFRDWRMDEKTGVVTEEENAFVSTVSGTRSWKFHEYDGHVTITLDDAGIKTSSRVSGGYGNVISESGASWALNAFHNVEDQGELLHMGQRHLMQEDGLWLQPEPNLYLGIPNNNVGVPRSLATYRYSLNSPTAYFDITGFDPEEGAVEGNDNIDVDSSKIDDFETPMETVEELNNNGKRDAAFGIIQGIVDNINPTGSRNNCASCAIATALTLRGTPSTCGDFDKQGNPIVQANTAALTDQNGRVQRVTGSEIENFFNNVLGENREFVPIGSGEDLQMIMDSAGAYSSGIMIGFVTDANGVITSSHAFNVINMDGNIKLIDGQIGGAANIDGAGYTSFVVMTTSD